MHDKKLVKLVCPKCKDFYFADADEFDNFPEDFQCTNKVCTGFFMEKEK